MALLRALRVVRVNIVCARTSTSALPLPPLKGGDNSDSAVGTFFEGCITRGLSSDAADDAVQADIVAARYGA